MDVNSTMRVYHRYLGFFLAGIMAMYAISGIVLIFRETGFLKSEKQITRTIKPNLTKEDLGRELRIRDLKITSEDGDIISFPQGTYHKASGEAKYMVKELPAFINKLTKVHKATTKDPLFFLNIFFGVSLLFFVISAFYMFLPSSSIFKKGLYFTLAGIVLFIILLLI